MVDLKTIKEFDPELYDSFVKEFDRQQYNLEPVITAVANSWISPKISRATG